MEGARPDTRNGSKLLVLAELLGHLGWTCHHVVSMPCRRMEGTLSVIPAEKLLLSPPPFSYFQRSDGLMWRSQLRNWLPTDKYDCNAPTCDKIHVHLSLASCVFWLTMIKYVSCGWRKMHVVSTILQYECLHNGGPQEPRQKCESHSTTAKRSSGGSQTIHRRMLSLRRLLSSNLSKTGMHRSK